MAIWSNSIVGVVYYDRTPAEEWTGCEVRIDDNEIVIMYMDAGGPVHYKGINDGTGHFELTSQNKPGRATLHRFKDGTVLEGYWQEGGYEGFWRIRLQE